MHATPFRLSAVIRMERHAATRLVRRAVSDAGGWITDFHQFSDFAVALELEITAARLAELHVAIEATGMALSPPRAELPVPTPGQGEVRGALRIEFVHDGPNCWSRSPPYLVECEAVF
jgi:hypothetical protein